MKIGFYCESPADRAALEIFVQGILAEPPEPINMDLEAHSVPGFFSALAGVFRGVHYNSDAEGLVIVVDCDDTELHNDTHDAPGSKQDRCRYCQIRGIIAQVRKHLKPRQNRPALKVAIGLAVPTIEAWYLVGKNHEVGEAAWKVGLDSGKRPFSRPQLKTLVYGTDRPSLELETERAQEEVRRIIANLNAMETAFPGGFGSMAREIRSWKSEALPGNALT